MTLRADHVAGAFFIGLGALVFALSGDLPTGSLSMPGSGFLPKILAGLSILFGIVLILRARESRPFHGATVDRRQACRARGRHHRGRHRSCSTGSVFSSRWCC